MGTEREVVVRIAAGVIAITVVGAGGAVAAPKIGVTWGTPATVGDLTFAVDEIPTLLTAGGQSRLLLRHRSGQVESVGRDGLTGPWRRLASLPQREEWSHVAMNRRGDIVAVGGSSGGPVTIATAGGALVQEILPGYVQFFRPFADTAINDRGEAVVVWKRPTTNGGDILASSRPVDGRWSTPRVVASDQPGIGFDPVVVAIGPSGTVVVLWQTHDLSGAGTLHSARWTGTSATEQIPVANGQPVGLGVDSTGIATAALVATSNLQALRLDPGSATWISDGIVGKVPAPMVESPKLDVSSDGTAVLAWRDEAGRVSATRRAPSQAWEPAQSLGFPRSVNVRVGAGDGGFAILGWTEGRGHSLAAVPWAAIRRGPVWEPQRVDTPAVGLRAMAGVAIAGRQRALAIWTRRPSAGATEIAVAADFRKGQLAPKPAQVRVARITVASPTVAGARAAVRVTLSRVVDGATITVLRRSGRSWVRAGSTTAYGRSFNIRVRLGPTGVGTYRLDGLDGAGGTLVPKQLTIRSTRSAFPLVAAGDSPFAVAAGASSVWVLSDDRITVGLRHIDTANGRLIGHPVGVASPVLPPFGEPGPLLAVGADTAWIARRDGTLLPVDAATMKAQTAIAIAGAPGDVPVALAAADDAVWVGMRHRSGTGDELVRIDATTRTVTARFAVSGRFVEPGGFKGQLRSTLTFAGGAVWATLESGTLPRNERAVELDPVTGAERSRVDGIVSVSAVGTTLWGMRVGRQPGSGPPRPTFVRLVPPEAPKGADLDRFAAGAFAAASDALWAARMNVVARGRQDWRVMRLDPRTATAVGSIRALRGDPNGRFMGVAASSGDLWIPLGDRGVIARIR